MSFDGARRSENELDGTHEDDVMVRTFLEASLEELSENGDSMVGSRREGSRSAQARFLSSSSRHISFHVRSASFKVRLEGEGTSKSILTCSRLDERSRRCCSFLFLLLLHSRGSSRFLRFPQRCSSPPTLLRIGFCRHEWESVRREACRTAMEGKGREEGKMELGGGRDRPRTS